MQPSIFNIRVPLKERDDVFLMNTLTDAQLVVSSDVAALLDRKSFDGLTDEERAELAHDLVTSLDGRADSNAAQEWDVEVLRRLSEIDSGTAALIDREEFSRRLRERLNRP